MIIRTNLATRPFYNERAVQVAVAVAITLVVGFTLLNVVQFVRLSASETRLGAHAVEAEREATRLRAEAARLRTRLDPKELASVAEAAREANGIIDQRAFSWTTLFSQLEATLPPDVRVKAVQPRLEQGAFAVAVVAQARKAEDLAAFMEALEATGVFREVKLVEQSMKDALLEAVIDSVYLAPGRATGAPAHD